MKSSIVHLQPTLINALQKRIAYLSIGRSALRNQGSNGLVAISRNFVAQLNINDFVLAWNSKRYIAYLDEQTRLLQRKYPARIRKQFGTARKALNLFFRDLVSNTHVVKLLNLSCKLSFLSQLELPLDSYTAKEIIAIYPQLKECWSGVKYLTAEDNEKLQLAAFAIARHNKIAKVQLDIYWWRKDL